MPKNYFMGWDMIVPRPLESFGAIVPERYLLAMQLGDKAWIEGARYYAPLFF